MSLLMNYGTDTLVDAAFAHVKINFKLIMLQNNTVTSNIVGFIALDEYHLCKKTLTE